MEREQLPIIQSICEGERTLQQRFPALAQRLKSTADQPFLVAAKADGPMQSALISTPEWECVAGPRRFAGHRTRRVFEEHCLFAPCVGSSRWGRAINDERGRCPE